MCASKISTPGASPFAWSNQGWSSASSRTRPAYDARMPTYILLTTLTSEGVQTIKNNPARIREVNREVEQLGATVTSQWATLGRFDFVNVVEAPDEETIARVSMELGSRGTGRYETLTAIPVDDFIASLGLDEGPRRRIRRARARSRQGASAQPAVARRRSRARQCRDRA